LVFGCKACVWVSLASLPVLSLCGLFIQAGKESIWGAIAGSVPQFLGSGFLDLGLGQWRTDDSDCLWKIGKEGDSIVIQDRRWFIDLKAVRFAEWEDCMSMRRGNGAGQNMATDLVSIVASMRVSCKDICN
jgi:hypothetical protein